MKIIVLGANGMLGHIVVKHLVEKGHSVFATSRDENSNLYFDAAKDIGSIEKIIEEIKPNYIINCIGILNKVAEEHHSLAIMVNSLLPHYLDELSIKHNFKLIHISTDCVFEGTKGNYGEDDIKDAKSFYGQSKSLGEINNDRNLTLRTSIIGPDINPNGIGLFQWFMQQENEVGGYSKVRWTGVTTIELAKIIENILHKNVTGLYHVVNGESITKYDLLKLIAKHFDKRINILKNDSVVSDKSLIQTKSDYPFEVSSYEKMIEDMKSWVLENQNLYPNLLVEKEDSIYESNDYSRN